MKYAIRALVGAAAAACVVVVAAQTPDGVKTHIGHVMTGFNGTPMNQGLLPTAMADAKVAAQHAALAAKSPDNLEAMKLHAGHVINALDPTIEAKGPGSGYGVKKAATGVATHIGLAAKVDGASAGVKTHSNHVATAATNVAGWSDEIVALAQKVRAASTAAEAAPLVAEMNTKAQALVNGMDANGDGRITWDKGEGGLTQADQHMGLMMKGEGMDAGMANMPMGNMPGMGGEGK